jgi:nucleotide-binding universal stress UspA family protein
MLPIHTILCPTDFSAYSDNAFHMACALARDYGARVIVLHVVPIPVVPYVTVAVPPPPEINLDEPREMLSCYTAPDASVAVERLLLEGEPREEIVEMARDRPCDLIVMGTHGRTGMGRLLMGSVAEAVVRAAPCPVLTIRTPPTLLPTETMTEAGALAGAGME